MNRKNVYVAVRMTAKEKEQLNKKAEALGITPSELLRLAINSKTL